MQSHLYPMKSSSRVFYFAGSLQGEATMKGHCPMLTGTGAEKQERHYIRSRAARLAQRAQMLFVFSPITLLHILSLLQFLLSLSVASSSTFTREKNKKGINKKSRTGKDRRRLNSWCWSGWESIGMGSRVLHGCWTWGAMEEVGFGE